MRPKKIAYVISEVHSSGSFEWLAESYLTRDMKFIFVLMNPSNTQLEDRLKELGQEVVRIPYASRRDLLPATARLTSLFFRIRPDVVHTHLLAANMAGLLAAWIARVPTRIYTHHHSNMNQVGPWHAKIYDWLPNILATKVIATCSNVKHLLLKEGVPDGKIAAIRFGFPSRFSDDISPERASLIRKKYELENHYPVIGVISRYVPYKGVPFIIQAFRATLNAYPNACLLLANAGQGADEERIRELLSKLPESSYREIAFENDSLALYNCFDFFVHAPIDSVSEAFGQVYVESMLARVPAVFTLSGVAHEIIRDGENALVVPYGNSEAIASALLKFLGNEELAKSISTRARIDAKREFSLEKMLHELGQEYS